MLYLEPNTIFDGRYRLIELLGQGASAQVWLAEDSLTNLRVAVKIFSAIQGEFDSYGAKDFQKEFTTVYNINHQNLLTPTNYSVNNGTPYLVLPYCENGSVSSMVGRCDEADVVKLLHDVAAGLEHLHRHNVIHQDIKPDNIMLDDDLNFMLSDFGISTGRNSESESYGGTRAYMSPERFNGVSDSKGDIWALGATAYEMLTGNAPFGDHGGLVQAQGEPMPPIERTDLSSGLIKLIGEMLDADPAKRPTPEQVRRRTALYLETGSWKLKNTGARTLRAGAIVLTLIAIAAGFFVWGMLRTKTYYYRDYVEVKGVPIGIGGLYGSEQRARSVSYRIQTRGGKVTRLSLVNGKGQIVEYQDAEELGVRFPDQEYHYGSDGEIDYMIARDSHGKVMYKFSYDEKGNNVDVLYDDDKNTPKFYEGTVRQPDANGYNATSSSIAHMRLEYDEHGRLVKRMFLSLLKDTIPDANGAFGQRYKYDEQGRVTEVTAIDRAGNAVGDLNGTSIRRYKYDDDGNRTEAAFFAADGNPSHEGHNIHIARFGYDEVGNMTSEMYFNGHEQPVASEKSGVFGYKYEYDGDGFRIRTTCVDADGEPMFNRNGYVAEVYEPDENNFVARIQLVDEENNPVTGNFNGDRTSGIRFINTATGLPLEMSLLDENGEQTDNELSISTIRRTFNDQGDMLTEETLRLDGTPVGRNGNDSRSVTDYDHLGRVKSRAYFDSDDNPTVNADGVHKIELTYSPYGSLEKVENFDTEGRPANSRYHFATHTVSYDSQGRNVAEAFLDADGKPVMYDGYSRIVNAYDASTARVNQTQFYDDHDRLLRTRHMTHDPATGRVATVWDVAPSGQLFPNTAKSHFTYNDLGFIVSVRATDLADRPVEAFLSNNDLDVKAHEIRNVYDNAGNLHEQSIWNASSSPAAAPDGTHRIVREYDNRNRLVHELRYRTDGSPIAGSGNSQAETEIKYDNRGNVTEMAAFDGYGKPAATLYGFHKRVFEYDRHNNPVSESYFDKAGNPFPVNPAVGFCRIEYEYDGLGNQTSMFYYNTSGTRIYTVRQKYNDHKVMTRQEVFDAGGRPSNDLSGYAVMEVKTSADGYTPVSQRYLRADGVLLGSKYYNKSTGQWQDAPVADSTPAVRTDNSSKSPAEERQGSNSGSGSGDNSWMADMRRQAAACPREIEDGIVMRSIRVSANSITITIANKNISGRNFDRSEVAQFARGYLSYPRDYFNVPASVRCSVVIYNRENQQIYPF